MRACACQRAPAHALTAATAARFLLRSLRSLRRCQEEPFSILPLEVLCDAVKAQSLELLASDAAVKDMVAGYERGGAEAAVLPPA